MNLLIEKFEQLKEIDDNWAQTVREEQKNDTPPENKELVRAFNELFSAARETYKRDAKQTESVFKTYMADDSSWLLEDVISSLEIFFEVSELRKMQSSDEKKAKSLIICLTMQSYILIGNLRMPMMNWVLRHRIPFIIQPGYWMV